MATEEQVHAQGGGSGGVSTNVGAAERTASAVLGGTLVAIGLARRSVAGAAVAVAGGALAYRAYTGHCWAYQAMGIGTAGGPDGPGEAGATPSAVSVTRSITIGKPAEELDLLWRRPETLAKVMGPFAEVTPAGLGAYRWKVRAPLGMSIEWESRSTEGAPGRGVSWESVEESSFPNEGEIRYKPAPGGRGTEVTLKARFDPPGGAIGRAAARFAGLVPRLMASTTLHYFKALAETGEIPTTEDQPAARADAR